MASETIIFKGIILSSTEYKEKDRIVSFLTREEAVIRFIAKGTTSPRCKYSFVAVPYVVCEVSLTRTGDLFYIKEGSLIEGNQGIYRDILKLQAASYISSILQYIMIPDEDKNSIYELTVYSLYCLSEDINPPRGIILGFNIKILEFQGFFPSFPISESRRIYCLYDGRFIVNFNGSINPNEGIILSSEEIMIIGEISSRSIASLFKLRISEDSQTRIYHYFLKSISYHMEKNYSDPMILEVPIIRK